MSYMEALRALGESQKKVLKEKVPETMIPKTPNMAGYYNLGMMLEEQKVEYKRRPMYKL